MDTLNIKPKLKIEEVVEIEAEVTQKNIPIPLIPAAAPSATIIIPDKIKTFKIETVKWKWPAAVKNKEVYRDDEFVRTKTKEEALEAIKFLMSQPKGLTYTITVFRYNEDENKGRYFTFYRHSMPCLGGLVFYKDSHDPVKHWMNPYFPRDIRVAFPEGQIIYIACHRSGCKKDIETPYWQFMFSPESPWIDAFGTKDTVKFEDNFFVLTNMETGDPTIFYSLMRLGGFAYQGIYGSSGGPQNNVKLNPKAELLLAKCGSPQADPRRLCGQRPIKTSGGTWSEGYAYSRMHAEHIFHTSLIHKYKEFGGLQQYPQNPSFTNKYFIDEMKTNFGIDIMGANLTDKKTHDALVESWDYFKSKVNELDEYDKAFREDKTI